MEIIQSFYHPDFSRYNEILCPDGRPINDINFVQNEKNEIASLLGQNVALNDNFLPPLDNIDEDDAFNSFVPKGVQSVDEISDYIDRIEYDKNK